MPTSVVKCSPSMDEAWFPTSLPSLHHTHKVELGLPPAFKLSTKESETDHELQASLGYTADLVVKQTNGNSCSYYDIP